MVVDSSGQPLNEVLWLPWYPGGPAGPSAAGPKDATTEHVTLKGPEVTRRPERPGMVTEEGSGPLQQQLPTEPSSLDGIQGGQPGRQQQTRGTPTGYH